jgi:ribose transport system permease protein
MSATRRISGAERGRRMLLSMRSYGLPLTALAATWIYFYATTDSFRGTGAVFPVLEGFALLGIVALGVGMTMLAGELDLSVASMAAVGGVVAVKMAEFGLVPALFIAAAVGVAVGATQGYAIARLGINSLVFTVGTLILLRGLAYLGADNKAILLENFEVSDPLLLRWWIISPGVITAAVLFVLAGAFLAFTKWGREIYAVGGGRQEAVAAGVPKNRAIVVTFTCSAALAALAGGIASIKGGSAAPGNYQDILLTGVSAALIGGVSLYGGRGTVLHIVLGVAVISTIAAGLAAKGSQGYVTQLATGALLVAVIAIEYGAARVAEARRHGVHQQAVFEGRGGAP